LDSKYGKLVVYEVVVCERKTRTEIQVAPDGRTAKNAGARYPEAPNARLPCAREVVGALPNVRFASTAVTVCGYDERVAAIV